MQYREAHGKERQRVPQVILDRRLPDILQIRRDSRFERMRTECAERDADTGEQRREREREAGRHWIRMKVPLEHNTALRHDRHPSQTCDAA